MADLKCADDKIYKENLYEEINKSNRKAMNRNWSN